MRQGERLLSTTEPVPQVSTCSDLRNSSQSRQELHTFICRVDENPIGCGHDQIQQETDPAKFAQLVQQLLDLLDGKKSETEKLS
jgi:hypothetical protein